jgi:hypothetical protein
MFEPKLIEQVVEKMVGSMPHPDLPSLSIRDYAAFRGVAARLSNTRYPQKQHIESAYKMLNSAGVSPSQFEYVWDIARPLANRLLGRDPSIHDIARLADAAPGDIQSHFLDHPHPQFPEVAAGDMARFRAAATPMANQYAKRKPNDVEVARFALSGYDETSIARHYGAKHLNDQVKPNAG